MKICWCNPCALAWTVIGAAVASHIWLNVDWTYGIAAIVVLLPVIAVIAKEESEDLWWTASSIVAEVWWLLKNRPERKPLPQLRKEPQ